MLARATKRIPTTFNPRPPTHPPPRPQAVRTPNHEGINWQKASLRTGESLDNLRRLLQNAKSKVPAVVPVCRSVSIEIS